MEPRHLEEELYPLLMIERAWRMLAVDYVQPGEFAGLPVDPGFPDAEQADMIVYAVADLLQAADHIGLSVATVSARARSQQQSIKREAELRRARRESP